MQKERFEKILVEAVDEGLSSLGQSSKRAIYFHLRESFNVEKEDIPWKVDAFTDAMEKIFGGGADFLEILIMKRLCKKIQGVLQSDAFTNFTFAEYVAAAREHHLEGKGLKKLAERTRPRDSPRQEA